MSLREQLQDRQQFVNVYVLELWCSMSKKTEQILNKSCKLVSPTTHNQLALPLRSTVKRKIIVHSLHCILSAQNYLRLVYINWQDLFTVNNHEYWSDSCLWISKFIKIQIYIRKSNMHLEASLWPLTFVLAELCPELSWRSFLSLPSLSVWQHGCLSHLQSEKQMDILHPEYIISMNIKMKTNHLCSFSTVYSQ